MVSPSGRTPLGEPFGFAQDKRIEKTSISPREISPHNIPPYILPNLYLVSYAFHPLLPLIFIKFLRYLYEFFTLLRRIFMFLC